MTDEPSESSSPALTASRRQGRGLRSALALLAALALAAAAYGLGYASGHRSSAVATPQHADAERYQCPMHPSVVQDHPGDCPICGMRLVRVEGPGHEKDATGVDLSHGHADEASGGAAVGGQATVEIDPARQQLIGLTTARVSSGPVGGSWRTVGRVAIDETRVRHTNVKVPGYVERIYVDYVGKTVRKGDPLFALYSPELLSTQQEFLLALRTQGALAKSGGALARGGEELVQAARRKLSLWDVPDAEIERIAKTGEPSKTLTFYSPGSGVVTRKEVVEGMKLDAGAMPYEIVDLSQVWVLADVYENELRHVRVGMPATLTLNAFPNREFAGKVLFVDPLLDPQTRTVKVRLAFANASGDLRPEMFGEVVLHGKPRTGLRIPEDAVLDSGTETLVFVALGQGKFEPRKVRLGEVDGSAVEVVSGLAEGEQVVTRANFLIDSESKLRASLAALPDTAEQMPESARVLPSAEPPAEPEPAHSHVHPSPERPASTARPARAAPTHEHAASTPPAPAAEAAPVIAPPPSALPEPAAAVQFSCPMHPSVVQDQPGKCPICGMRLVERRARGTP